MSKEYEKPQIEEVNAEKVISDARKPKMGCWGPSPEDDWNQC